MGDDRFEEGEARCPLLSGVGLAARMLLLGAPAAHPRRVGITEASLARETVGGRHAADDLAGDLQEPITQLQRRVLGGARHLVEHLLEVEVGMRFERRQQRRRERRMRAGWAVERSLPELRRGDEQQPLHGTGLDARERELLALEIGADLVERIIAAGIQDQQLHPGEVGCRQEPFDRNALRDGAGCAIHVGVDGRQDIALVGRKPMAGEVDER